MNEPTLSDAGTTTQNTADVYKLPWLSGDVHPAHEQYTPPSCTGRLCSVVELPWTLAGIECSGSSMIANNKGM